MLLLLVGERHVDLGTCCCKDGIQKIRDAILQLTQGCEILFLSAMGRCLGKLHQRKGSDHIERGRENEGCEAVSSQR